MCPESNACSNKPTHGTIARLVGAVTWSVFGNPLAVIVAVMGIWLVVLLLVGIPRFTAGAGGWGLTDILSCGVSLTALVLATGLALGHLVITTIAVWGVHEPL